MGLQSLLEYTWMICWICVCIEVVVPVLGFSKCVVGLVMLTILDFYG